MRSPVTSRTLARGIPEAARGDETVLIESMDFRPDLPSAFRGYDRTATDALLAQLDDARLALARERDELRRQFEAVQHDLDQHRERAQAVGDALVTAQLLAQELRAKAESQLAEERRELGAAREKLDQEADDLRSHARHEATEIVREARVRADRVIDEVANALGNYRTDTDEFLESARVKLDALVQEVLERMPASVPAPSREVETEEAEPEEDAPAAAVA
jgi:cell division septum initiation protein DivIVA